MSLFAFRNLAHFLHETDNSQATLPTNKRDLHLLRGSICWSLDRILKEKYRTQKNEEKSRTVSPGPLLVQLLVLRVLVLLLLLLLLVLLLG